MSARMIVIILAILFCGYVSRADDWPQFRGPRGDGHSHAFGLPTTWGSFLEPPAWKTVLPGTGWSSPIVIGERVWVTAAEQTALTEKAFQEKLEKNAYGSEGFTAHAAVTLLAVELDARSGEVLRRIDLLEIEEPAPIHVFNSYASPTPVTDGQRVYCHFGSFGTVCLSIESGDILWTGKLVVEDITGPAGSPVLCGDHLILVRDGCDQQYVIALDKFSGEVVWQQARPPIEALDDKYRRAFVTPLIIDAAEGPQLIAPTANWIVSYDPADGRELWRVRMADGHALVPRPVYADGLVYVCSGYHEPQLYAVRVDGSGDVTETHIQWTHDRQVSLISSPLLSGCEIYFVSTIGIATCLDARTGERLWQERLSGNFSASPLSADGKIYFTSEAGMTTVLRPGREFHELARNQLFGLTRASLAVAGDSLLIRTAEALFCVRKTQFDGLSGR